MSALPAPMPSPNNRDIIQNLRAEYGGAIAEAIDASFLTATTAWQRMYHDFFESAKAARRDMAKRLRLITDRLEDRGLDEDDEKAMKDILKAATTLEDAKLVFERETVSRVKKPVDDCERIANDYINRATRIENAAPLVEVGLVEIIKAEIAKHPAPSWNEVTGIVTIHERER